MIMTQTEIRALAASNQAKAHQVLDESGIVTLLEKTGCRVNIIGSLRMQLLVTHNDIDLHIYSSGITVESSFAIMAQIAADQRVSEVRYINGLHTEERCLAWHINYNSPANGKWKFDIIHIEEGSLYDGYFEKMAERIVHVMTPEQRDTILRLKFEAPDDSEYHGVEFYEAVIADGVSDMDAFQTWVSSHRKRPPYYWIP